MEVYMKKAYLTVDDGPSVARREKVDILKPSVTQYISAMHEQAKGIADDQVLHSFYAMAPDSGTSDRHYGETFTTDTDKVRIASYANNSVYQQK